MKKPKHFEDALAFEIFMVGCAIRDRETFIDACKPHPWSEIDEATQKAIDETALELKSFRSKYNALVKKQNARRSTSP